MSSHEQDEMMEARKRAADAQVKYDRIGDAAYARAQAALVEPVSFEARGNWQFVQLHSAAGVLTGWRVLLNGKLAAMVVLSVKGPVCIGTSRDEDLGAPSALDVMAALLKAGIDLSAPQTPAAEPASDTRVITGTDRVEKTIGRRIKCS